MFEIGRAMGIGFALSSLLTGLLGMLPGGNSKEANFMLAIARFLYRVAVILLLLALVWK